MARNTLGIEETPQPTNPIAVDIGIRFERALSGNNGARLREQYGSIDQIDPESITYLVLDQPATRASDSDTFKALCTRHLTTPNGEGSTLVAQPPVQANYRGYEISLRPDLVYLHHHKGHPTLRVGEIKSQYDVGGYTAPHVVRRAALQTAAGVFALRLMLTQWGFDPEVVAPETDLVMRGAKNLTHRRAVSIDGELVAVQGFFDRIATTANTTAAPNHRDDLETIPHRYTPECETRCDLVAYCRDKVAPTIWDHPAHSALAGLGVTPERAAALAAGATPTPDEAEIAVWLQ